MHPVVRTATIIMATTAGALRLLGGTVSAAPPPPPPAEAFGQLPAMQFAAVSPNGRQLVVDDVKAGQRRIVVWDVESGNARPILNIDTSSKLRGLHWSDDETVMIDASIQQSVNCNATERCALEWFRLFAVPRDGGKPRTLLMNDGEHQWVSGATLLATHTARPRSITMETLDYSAGRQQDSTGSHIARSERDRTGWASVVFAVDTKSGAGKPLATGTQFTQQWVVDARGEPVARSEWEPARSAYSIVARLGDRWQTIYSSDDDDLSLAGLTMDGKSIVVLGYHGDDRKKAWSLPLDGSTMSVLYEDPQGDVDRAAIDPYTNAVVGVMSSGPGPAQKWFDERRAAKSRTIGKTFPGGRTEVVDESRDGERMIVKVDRPSEPPTYRLFDFAKSRADVIGESYPGLAGAKLGSVQFVTYAARDGLPIPAYLTLPPGREPKGLPLVVLPHGGPEWRDEGGFDFLAQFLATRGYAVLQPQFRGSTGFGDAFRRAGYRQWGLKMQDDVTDGVRHLIDDGTADPKRVCIVGGSYGGYSALAGAAFTPELYACAASYGGVSDLVQMLIDVRRLRGADSDAIAYWYDHIGPTSDPVIAAKSPARSAATFRAPILLLHGVDDSVVPISQSEKMANALEKAGKPVTFVRLPGEDHWMSQSATRVRVLQELERFLAQYLH